MSGVCEDAIQLNEMLKNEQVDLLFLDIEMPYLSGIDWLTSINHRPHIILTTAYEQYALKGYELDVVDYLLKPISFERFLKAVNKVHSLIEENIHQLPNVYEYIYIRSDRQIHKIFIKDILFIEGMENYLCIYTENGKLLTRSTIKHIQETLPNSLFIQVHKSYLINLKKIDMIEGNLIRIKHYNITISRNYRESFFTQIQKNVL